MGDGRGPVGARPGFRAPVPRGVAQQRGPDHQGGHREIPGRRHGQGHRAGLRPEAGAQVRGEDLRHHRELLRPPGGSGGHRPPAPAPDQSGLGRAEGHPRHHGVPPFAGSQHQPGGPHLQDLRGEGHRAGAGRPLHAGPRHPRHRLRHGGPDRPEDRHPA